MAKILVIEDDEAIALLLDYDLRIQNHDVKVVNDGKHGLDLVLNGDFDLILVDWMLPNLSGLEIIEKARAQGVDTKIIMLTAKSAELDIVKGLDSGADDFISKPFSSRELASRINVALRSIQKKKKIIYHDLEIDLDSYKISKLGNDIKLSKTEFNLFIYLWENRGIILTRELISEFLNGNSYDKDERNVDVYISNIKKKLDLKSEIETKRGIGYLLKK